MTRARFFLLAFFLAAAGFGGATTALVHFDDASVRSALFRVRDVAILRLPPATFASDEGRIAAEVARATGPAVLLALMVGLVAGRIERKRQRQARRKPTNDEVSAAIARVARAAADEHAASASAEESKIPLSRAPEGSAEPHDVHAPNRPSEPTEKTERADAPRASHEPAERKTARREAPSAGPKDRGDGTGTGAGAEPWLGDAAGDPSLVRHCPKENPLLDTVIKSPRRRRDAASSSLRIEDRKILLVDDDPLILQIYKRLIETYGFQTLTAGCGIEAYQVILEERPDVAVIDYRMPLLSGIQVCEKIRQEPKLDDMKVVIFTVDEQSRTRREALNAGADAVVTKVEDPAVLLTTLAELIEDTGSPTR